MDDSLLLNLQIQAGLDTVSPQYIFPVVLSPEGKIKQILRYPKGLLGSHISAFIALLKEQTGIQEYFEIPGAADGFPAEGRPVFPLKEEYINFFNSYIHMYSKVPSHFCRIVRSEKDIVAFAYHQPLLPRLDQQENPLFFFDSRERLMACNIHFYSLIEAHVSGPGSILGAPLKTLFVKPPLLVSEEAVAELELRKGIEKTIQSVSLKAGSPDLEMSRLDSVSETADGGLLVNNNSGDYVILSLKAPLSLLNSRVHFQIEFLSPNGHLPILMIGNRGYRLKTP